MLNLLRDLVVPCDFPDLSFQFLTICDCAETGLALL